jgi:hypothetical protein
MTPDRMIWSISIIISLHTSSIFHILSDILAQKRLRDLKTKISSQSKKNFVLERDVRYLDSRIALLIQNASHHPALSIYTCTHQSDLNFPFFEYVPGHIWWISSEWPWVNEKKYGNIWRKQTNQKDFTWTKREHRCLIFFVFVETHDFISKSVTDLPKPDCTGLWLIQQYANLFFLLQSEPRHIAALCRLVSMGEIDTLLQTVMFTLYGNQYENREEHLLLTMFQVRARSF